MNWRAFLREGPTGLFLIIGICVMWWLLCLAPVIDSAIAGAW